MDLLPSEYLSAWTYLTESPRRYARHVKRPWRTSHVPVSFNNGVTDSSLTDLMREQARLWRRSRQLHEIERDMEDHLVMYRDTYRTGGHLGTRYTQLLDRITQLKDENTILQKLTSSQVERYLRARNEVSRDIGNRLEDYEPGNRDLSTELYGDTRWARLEREITKFDVDQKRRFRDFHETYVRKLYFQMGIEVGLDSCDFAPKSDCRYVDVYSDRRPVASSNIELELDEAIARALNYRGPGDCSLAVTNNDRVQIQRDETYEGNEQVRFERDEDKDYDESEDQMERDETREGKDHICFKQNEEVSSGNRNEMENDKDFTRDDRTQMGEECTVNDSVHLKNDENVKVTDSTERKNVSEFTGNDSILLEKDNVSTGKNHFVQKKSDHELSGTDRVQMVKDDGCTGSDRVQFQRAPPDLSAVGETKKKRKSSKKKYSTRQVQNKTHGALGEQIIEGLKRNLNERLNPQCSGRPGSVLTRTGHYGERIDTRQQYEDEGHQRVRSREASAYAARSGIRNRSTKDYLYQENRMVPSGVLDGEMKLDDYTKNSRLKRDRSAGRKAGKTFLYTPEERDKIVKNVKRCFINEIPFCIYSNYEKRFARR